MFFINVKIKLNFNRIVIQCYFFNKNELNQKVENICNLYEEDEQLKKDVEERLKNTIVEIN